MSGVGLHIPTQKYIAHLIFENIYIYIAHLILKILGFLGRSGAESQTLLTESEDEVYKLVNDSELEVTGMRVLCGGRFARVDYKPKVEKAVKTGSIVMAVMTTAYARIKLYSMIAQYPEAVRYFDTDSLFLLLPAGVSGPEASGSLGCLKDEIREAFGPKHYISSFYCLGPKTYSFTVVNEDGQVVHTELKAKGLTLSAQAREVVTTEAMRQMASNRDPSMSLAVPQFQVSQILIAPKIL